MFRAWEARHMPHRARDAAGQEARAREVLLWGVVRRHPAYARDVQAVISAFEKRFRPLRDKADQRDARVAAQLFGAENGVESPILNASLAATEHDDYLDAQRRNPHYRRLDQALDDALDATFPASDPIAWPTAPPDRTPPNYAVRANWERKSRDDKWDWARFVPQTREEHALFDALHLWHLLQEGSVERVSSLGPLRVAEIFALRRAKRFSDRWGLRFPIPQSLETVPAGFISHPLVVPLRVVKKRRPEKRPFTVAFKIYPRAGSDYVLSFVNGVLDHYQRHRQPRDESEARTPRRVARKEKRPWRAFCKRQDAGWISVFLMHPDRCDGRALEAKLSKYLIKSPDKVSADTYELTFEVVDYLRDHTWSEAVKHLERTLDDEESRGPERIDLHRRRFRRLVKWFELPPLPARFP
jgi:hypothetical protein